VQKAHTLRYRYRLDRDIYDWLRRYGAGYSTRINNILRAVMSGGGSAVHFHA
jgi:uncharacterized protein (DUF4415 family)